MAVFSGNGSNTAPSFTFSSDTNTGVYRVGEDSVGITTGGSLRLTVDANGQAGLGVTPSVASTGRALTIGTAGNGVTSWFGNSNLVCNHYYDSVDKFAGTGWALQYYQDPVNGLHVWRRSSASGTAGNNATMQEAMRVTSTNSVLVGAAGFQCSSTKNIFGTDGSDGYIAARGIAAGSGTAVVDTGISINAGTVGRVFLVLACRNTSNGTATDAALYLIQFYVDGNNAPAVTFVSGDSNFATFGTSGSNTLTVTGNVGNWEFGAIWTGAFV